MFPGQRTSTQAEERVQWVRQALYSEPWPAECRPVGAAYIVGLLRAAAKRNGLIPAVPGCPMSLIGSNAGSKQH